MKQFTRDDSSQHNKLRFYATEKIGDKRSITPDGFLLCEEVPIARTGEMYYGPGETPLSVGDGGYVTVVRDEAAVFHPIFLASFEGKPITNDHPAEEVTPANWKQYAVGTVINPRRGEGQFASFVVADLLVMEQSAIDEVMSGKREVSCGYDAEYEPTGPGRGRQYDMVGNHVALVDAGRCGPRCAIRDRRNSTEDTEMKRSVNDRKAFHTRLKAAVAAKDQAAIDALMAEDEAATNAPETEEHIHIHQGGTMDAAALEEIRGAISALDGRFSEQDARLKKLSAHVGFRDADEDDEESEEEKETADALEEEAPSGKGKDARKAKDSALLSESYQEVVALSEVLMPGVKVPAFVADAKPKDSLKLICDARRRALDLAYATPEGEKMIKGLNGDRPLILDGMKCRDVRTIFRAAGSMKKSLNSLPAPITPAPKAKDGLPKRPTSPAEMNAFNSKHFNGQANA